jgi:addiction module RelE/StbE family toxin
MPVKYPVKWLELALRDMDEIAEYIARDNPRKACEIVQAIWDSGQSLNTFPSRGRTGRMPSTRELILPKLPYFIAYRIKDGTVQILRILHTSRQWPPIADE